MLMRKPPDPIAFCKLLWPKVHFYDKQREIIRSVCENDETYVPAGNMMGKDFVAAYIILYFFLTRHPCRIVTTSVVDRHLQVLWGEIKEAIDNCEYSLAHKAGGCLIINERRLRKVVGGNVCGLSYVQGMVADDMNAMQGHHIAKTGDGVPRTLFVVDETAGVRDDYYDMAATWANRILAIANCNPCTNFFFKAVKKGNVKAEGNGHYYSKVIRIKAEDSPNVRLALAQKARGLKVTNEILIPGVLPAEDYFKRRKTWNKMRQCVGLDGEFYTGAEILLFPPEWLNNAEMLARKPKTGSRGKVTLGVDSAAGGDNTVWLVLSENHGVLEIFSIKTPDTAIIPGKTIAMMRKYNIPAANVLFDYGGGGKQHVDILRRKDAALRKIRCISFGASATPEKKHGMTLLNQRKKDDEIRYAYKNRRAEMYGLASRRLDPNDGGGLPIPEEYEELRRQLAPIPRQDDGEGRLYLPKKQRKNADDLEVTMTELVGCSPDEADAFVLANFGLDKTVSQIVLGASF